MPPVFKVAKPGFDIFKDNEESFSKAEIHNKKKLDNIYAYPTFALIYWEGAKTQMLRYKRISQGLVEEGKNLNLVFVLLHETSCLLEDLNTVSKYLSKCNEKHELNSLIRTMRNHFRHDIRERFNDTSYSEKIKAHKKLGIASHLQTDITFYPEYIQIGEKKLHIEKIEQYLDWAWECMTKIWDSALEKGYIKEKFW